MKSWQCRHHGLIKDEEIYVYNNRRSCKICARERRKKWVAKEGNLERAREFGRKWYTKNSKSFMSREEVRSYPDFIDTSKEIWKAVAGYEDYYAVSNMGRVRSEARIIEKKDGNTMKVKEKIFKGWVHKKCFTVKLSKEGKHIGVSVARLVLEAFFRSATKYEEAGHKDQDIFNNKIDNLFYEDKIHFDSLTQKHLKVLEDKSIGSHSIRKKSVISISTGRIYRKKLNNNLGN